MPRIRILAGSSVVVAVVLLFPGSKKFRNLAFHAQGGEKLCHRLSPMCQNLITSTPSYLEDVDRKSRYGYIYIHVLFMHLSIP